MKHTKNMAVAEGGKTFPNRYIGITGSGMALISPWWGVSWYEAFAYAQWLSRKTVKDYRLPTEAQWEKAARGSRGFQYPWGDKFDKDKCNTDECGLGRTSPVGIFGRAKSLRMYGCGRECLEWCSDRYAGDYYEKKPAKNPAGPAEGSVCVLRGGSWFNGELDCRGGLPHPADRGGGAGFRLLMSL